MFSWSLRRRPEWRIPTLRDLKDETFLTIPEQDAPGYNPWVRSICRKAGFRPRFGESAESMAHLVSMIAAESVAAIVPQYAIERTAPGLHILLLEEDYVVADLIVAWQRGKLSEPVRRMLAALFPKTAKQ